MTGLTELRTKNLLTMMHKDGKGPHCTLGLARRVYQWAK
jgi:hypothetical protein